MTDENIQFTAKMEAFDQKLNEFSFDKDKKEKGFGSDMGVPTNNDTNKLHVLQRLFF